MLLQHALFSLAASSLALAHGDISSMIANGKTYKGPSLGENADGMIASPIRQISIGGPVTDVTSPDMLCGPGSKLNSIVAEVAAGSQITLSYEGEGGGTWVHDMGPILSYLAPCKDGDCTKDVGTTDKFFKIAQAGQKSPNGPFVQADLNSGKPYVLTVPKGTPAGSYLMRQEIIALHNAMSKGGAEFYVSCIQLKVTNPAVPASDLASVVPSSDLVSFPGAYSPTDKGILVNVYSGSLDYSKLFPGPSIAPSLLSGAVSNGNVPKPGPPKSSSSIVSLVLSSPTATPTTTKTKSHAQTTATPTTTPAPKPHGNGGHKKTLVLTLTITTTVIIDDEPTTSTATPSASSSSVPVHHGAVSPGPAPVPRPVNPNPPKPIAHGIKRAQIQRLTRERDMHV